MRYGVWLRNGQGLGVKETVEYALAAEEGGWDGIMPTWPALLGEEESPEGQPPSGRPIVDEFREMLTYYRSLTDAPGEIIVPDVPADGYREVCDELGVTWLFRSRFERPDDLLAGPPT